MAELLFSSDLHFAHASILTFSVPCHKCGRSGRIDGKRCGKCVGLGQHLMRPFADLEEMHHKIISRHNEMVRPQDHWYCLGDLTMLRKLAPISGLLKSMNGHKRLILGNHDSCKMEDYLEYFEKVMSYRVIDDTMFSHIPIHPESMARFHANVHGHIHSNRGDTIFDSFPPVIRGDGRIQPYLNLSMEATNYYPLSLAEIKAAIKKAVKASRGYVRPHS